MATRPGPVADLITRRAVLAGIGTAAVLAACGRGGRPDRQPSAPAYLPPTDGSWATLDPATTGWDVTQLESFADFAGERATKSLLVLQDGRILLERTWGAPDHRRDIASAQKSLMSSLVGISVAQGELDREAPVDRYLGRGWSSAPRADEAGILVRHLLTMTTGLTESLDPVAEPGTTWDYNNTTYQLVRPVLEQATGLGIEPLTRRRLFDPIGVSDRSSWYERPGGAATSVDPTGRRLWGLVMTARRPRTRRTAGAASGILGQRRGAPGDRAGAVASTLAGDEPELRGAVVAERAVQLHAPPAAHTARFPRPRRAHRRGGRPREGRPEALREPRDWARARPAG